MWKALLIIFSYRVEEYHLYWMFSNLGKMIFSRFISNNYSRLGREMGYFVDLYSLT